MEYVQEPFSSYQHKVSRLCASIGLGTPTNIHRLKGGSYNRVIGLEFTDAPRAIIRIPRCDEEWEPSLSTDIKDQIAILKFVREKGLPVAQIVAYDATTKNSLGRQYVIQQWLPGRTLNDVYNKFSKECKESVVREFVNVLKKLNDLTFPGAGTLAAAGSLPDTSVGPVQSTLTVRGLTVGRECPNPPVTRPQNSLAALFRTQFSAWEDVWAHYRLNSSVGTPVKEWPKLRKIFEEMETLGWMDGPSCNRIIMHHWDLEPRNILVSDDGYITGILDWDDALALPLILTRGPPLWIWSANTTGEWSKDPESLPEMVLNGEQAALKKLFDKLVDEAIPGYTKDTYGNGKWIRRLWRYPWVGGHGRSFMLRGCEQLVEDWKRRGMP